MQAIQLKNPTNLDVSSKFLTGNGADISTFPKMIKESINEKINYHNIYAQPSYIEIGEVVYKVVCIAMLKELTIYVTTEKGQIVDVLNDNELDFINYTQIQVIGLKYGLKI